MKRRPVGQIVSDALDVVGSERWSWREESNLQPAVYKTAALPLSYASSWIDDAFI